VCVRHSKEIGLGVNDGHGWCVGDDDEIWVW